MNIAAKVAEAEGDKSATETSDSKDDDMEDVFRIKRVSHRDGSSGFYI